MAVRFEGEEIQTDRDVTDLLAQVRRDPRTSNPRVLAINQIRQMQAKNDGYPVYMHHDTLSPTMANNEKEEEALAQAGFRREYRHRDYPKCMFRRNMHPKFAKSQAEQLRIAQLTVEAQRIEYATCNEGDFIEERVVKNLDEERKLLAEPENVAAGRGAWVFSPTEIQPFGDGPAEDPQVTIARLQGELAAYKGETPEGAEQPEKKRGPGRPRKDEQVA